jgi:hypothetical protein
LRVRAQAAVFGAHTMHMYGKIQHDYSLLDEEHKKVIYPSILTFYDMICKKAGDIK